MDTTAPALDTDSSRPNILLLVTDHWRFDWLPVMGMDALKTPNLDRLCEQGVYFDRACCNSPQCGPSRVSFTAGKYPGRLGCYGNAVGVYPAKSNGFSDLLPTYANRLQAAGYWTGTVGKMDLCKAPLPAGGTVSPLTGDATSGFPLMQELGFSSSREMLAKWRGNPGDHIAHYFGDAEAQELFVTDYAQRKSHTATPWPLPTEMYWDTLIGQQARQDLRKQAEASPRQPWFMQVNFQAPHLPWDAPQEYLDRYEGACFPDSVEADLDCKSPVLTKSAYRWPAFQKPEYLPQIKRSFAAMMSVVDDEIGKLLDLLDEIGQRENTVVIFTSDHGEMLGDFGFFCKEKMYEGAVRVPMLVCGSGVSARGISHALVELVDLHPTILDLAGVPCPPEAVDGTSMRALLAGETTAHKDYQYAVFDPQAEAPYAQARMIADKRYKLIHNYGTLELYDLQRDPQERVNIAGESPEQVERLLEVLAKFDAHAISPQIP